MYFCIAESLFWSLYKICAFIHNENIEKDNQIVVRFTIRIIRQKIFMHELLDSKYAWQLKIRFKLTDST